MVGEDYVVTGGFVLITLVVGEGTPGMGMSLEFFNSGFGDSSPALSGFASLTAPEGNYSYPEGMT